MKIQCDVCSKESASFFCPADDAALCGGCDHSVHRVNKLAGKHQRFSLTTSSSSESDQQIPLCDICQENRAFLFCQQDRAILCWGCDYSIHNANKNTRNHSRFLLTGTKLSLHTTSSALYSSPPPPPHSAAAVQAKPMMPASIGGGEDTSSISEYLIQTLPGWRVDDFLDSNAHTFDLSKGVEEEELVLMSRWESEFRCNSTLNSCPYTFFSTPKTAVIHGEFAVQNTIENGVSFTKWTEEEEEDRSFIVPQILNNSNSSKRPRFA